MSNLEFTQLTSYSVLGPQSFRTDGGVRNRTSSALTGARFTVELGSQATSPNFSTFQVRPLGIAPRPRLPQNRVRSVTLRAKNLRSFPSRLLSSPAGNCTQSSISQDSRAIVTLRAKLSVLSPVHYWRSREDLNLDQPVRSRTLYPLSYVSAIRYSVLSPSVLGAPARTQTPIGRFEAGCPIH